MRIALINGSPKVSSSASESVLCALKPLLTKDTEILDHQFRRPHVHDRDLEQMLECTALVFAFPLYVDGIPSHLLHCLAEMEKWFRTCQPRRKITVYSLVNCGFYEGDQTAIALEMMRHWCRKAGLCWGQGVGIGGGGMLPMLAAMPEGQGPAKNLARALRAVANNICTGTTADDLLISPNFPKVGYKLAAQLGWRRQAKASGLQRRDLSRRR